MEWIACIFPKSPNGGGYSLLPPLVELPVVKNIKNPKNCDEKKKKIQQRSKIKRMGDDLKHVRACKVTMSFWLFGLIFIRRGSRHTRTNISSLHLCLSVSMRSNPKAPPPRLLSWRHARLVDVRLHIRLPPPSRRAQPAARSRAGCCPLTAPPTTPLNLPPPSQVTRLDRVYLYAYYSC